MLQGSVSGIVRFVNVSRSVIATQLGVAPPVVTGVAMTAVAATAVWTGAVGFVLGQAPRPIRDLPGVRTLAQVMPPTYQSVIVGVRSPLGVAVTSDGSTLYVVEGTGERLVRKIRLRDGGFEADLVPPLTTAATRKPMSVAVRPDGVVYVVDQARRVVDVYSQDGMWAGILPPPAGENDWSPLSVDVDDGGGAYVTNISAAGPLLVIYGRDEKIVSSVPAVAVDGLPIKYPNGVAVTQDGKIAFSDSNYARIVLFDPKSGEAIKVWSRPTEDLAVPRGIAIETHRLGLIADTNDHTLSAWDLRQDGEGRIYQIGGPGVADGEFLFPNDLVVGRDGRIYVADRDNDRVQIWR